MKKILFVITFLIPVLIISSIYNFNLLAAESSPAENFDPITYIENTSFDQIISDHKKLPLTTDFEKLQTSLWNKYKNTLQNNSNRKKQHDERQIKYGTKIMKFSLDKIGTKPSNGYPLYIALHGGGSATQALNDSQWEQMKIYYKSSVKNGIYVAPRGVTDTWNLHFVDESYALYDYLIENMIAYENVDPNRVYILGFSAGGDGVYQITPKMADRFAAANMSAGHPNGIKMDNLKNTPFLLQLGENDSSFSRNIEAVNYFEKLNKLQNNTKFYVHDLFLHKDGTHNSWRDNDNTGNKYTILADPIAWRDKNDKRTVTKNTNAIQWLDTYNRNPIPEEIVWDTTTFAPRTKAAANDFLNSKQLLSPPNKLFFWLDMSQNNSATNLKNIVANLDKNSNSININSIDQNTTLRLLINNNMLDLTKPIKININQDNQIKTLNTTIQPDLSTMARTLLERGDKSYIFQSDLIISNNSEKGWYIK